MHISTACGALRLGQESAQRYVSCWCDRRGGARMAESLSSRELLEDAARRSIQYREGLASRGVAPSSGAVAGLSALDEPMPDQPLPPQDVLRLLDEVGSPATVAMAGPRFFGFVIGGSLPVTLAANWLAGAWDQNSALYNVTPATARIEQIALRWLLDLLDLPPGERRRLSSPGRRWPTSALWQPRATRSLSAPAANVEADGLCGAPPISVVVGAEAHPTLFKSLGLLGSRAESAGQGAGRLAGTDAPRCAAGAIGSDDRDLPQAGNVNTGAFDPLARSRESRTRPAPGSTWMGPSVSGHWPSPPWRIPHRRDGPGGLVGDRCPQVAERPL